ncbi:MAG: MBL fold metallo-hydrolase [Candidatus Limnocylindrales bacterium]
MERVPPSDGMHPAVSVTELRPGIHQIRLPMPGSRLRSVNAYLIEGDDGPLLVDCGWDLPEVFEALTASLRHLGYAVSDLRTIVVTHYHSDHYGLAGRLVELSGADLVMHPADWRHVVTYLADGTIAALTTSWLERNGLEGEHVSAGEEIANEDWIRFRVVEPTRLIEDGETIEIGGRTLEAVWTPGHTPGHLCIHDHTDRLLLTGDHVLDPITPHVSRFSEAAGNPLGAYLASLRRVAGIDVDLVLPAHGEAFGGLADRVRELLEHHREREDETLAALGDEPRSGAFVAQQLRWTRRRQALSELPPGQQRMALGETLAHLEELRVNGQIVALEREGKIIYRRSSGTGVA